MVWCSSLTVCEESYVKAPMDVDVPSTFWFMFFWKQMLHSFCLMAFEGLVGTIMRFSKQLFTPFGSWHTFLKKRESAYSFQFSGLCFENSIFPPPPPFFLKFFFRDEFLEAGIGLDEHSHRRSEKTQTLHKQTSLPSFKQAHQFPSPVHNHPSTPRSSGDSLSGVLNYVNAMVSACPPFALTNLFIYWWLRSALGRASLQMCWKTSLEVSKYLLFQISR